METAPGLGSIAPGTGMGAVHLSITSLERSVGFYRKVVGLQVIAQDDESAHLGVGGKELLVLRADASGAVARGRTGLYHFALVVPSRKELARTVARLTSLRHEHYPTDHVLTKSDYLWDPDGNGIEIYAESPEDGTWVIEPDGFYAIDTNGVMRSGRDPIDLEALMRELESDDQLDLPLPPDTNMGHVHLHVRDVGEAVHFWSDVVGFGVTGISTAAGVAFVAAGGYHHHLGLNTWAGDGAPPPPPEASGLRYLTVKVPTVADVDEVADRLRVEGSPVSDRTVDRLFADDPSGNRVCIEALGRHDRRSRL